MSEEIKLLPCPFCGSEANLIAAAGDYAQYYLVICSMVNCQCQTSRATKEEVIKDWNTRTTPQPPVEQLKKDISNTAKIGLLTGALEGLLHYQAPINAYDYGEMKKRINEVLEQSKTYGD